MHRPSSLALLLIFLACGCTSVNKPLNAPQVALEDRKVNKTYAIADDANITDADGYFVGIAISGGGSRSANYSAACMFQLQRLDILKHVDFISSVSGGSMTAAYYCLTHDGEGPDDWNPASAQKKLTHSYATDVAIQAFLPWNIFAMLFTHYDRSDLLAKSFDDNLYRGTTFENLRTDRPHLLINATDLQSGRGFVFCNETFNQLNSDLSKYPIAYAVAASSAVPVALHHVTLADFSTTFPQYLHLVDGSVIDNLGVRSLVDLYHAHQAAAKKAGRPLPYPNGAIFIVLDAKTQLDAQLNSKGEIGIFEGFMAGASLTSTVLLNRISSATLAELILEASPDNATAGSLREEKRTLEQDGYLKITDRENRPMQVVHLALSRLKDVTDLPFSSFHERVNRIETYFNISDEEANQLYQAADILVREKFEAPLRDIAKELSAKPPGQ